jgi:hypothetical protein
MAPRETPASRRPPSHAQADETQAMRASLGPAASVKLASRLLLEVIIQNAALNVRSTAALIDAMP